MITVLLLIAGCALIVAGANYFTEGASSLAARFGISQFIIGLTVVAIGTSLPELVVSLLSALKGSSDMAIGNVIGSNMFNLLVILAMSVLIQPIPLTRNNVRKDIPFLILASAACLVVASDTFLGGGTESTISRSEGLLLLGFFIVFMAYSIFSGSNTGTVTISDKRQRVLARKRSIWLVVLMIVGGCAGLIFGANLFLDNAVSIARSLGVSEAVIGVTLVAAGTSMPELAASVAAAVKGNTGMALGNVVGSNISNIFLVLGASATVQPLTLGGIVPGDMLAMIASSVLLFLCCFTFRKNYMDRTEGVIFLLLYVAYVWWLLVR